jgi:hypothetical protein
VRIETQLVHFIIGQMKYFKGGLIAKSLQGCVELKRGNQYQEFFGFDPFAAGCNGKTLRKVCNILAASTRMAEPYNSL